MATGETLFILDPLNSNPTATVPATLDRLAITGATPDSYIPVLDFSGTVIEHADWFVIVPANYAGGGFDFQAFYAIDGASSAGIRLEFRGIKFAEDDALPTARVIDTQTEGPANDTPASATADDLSITAAVSVSAANLGTPAAGDFMQIRVTRDPVDANDTNTNDLQLIKVLVSET